MRRGLLSFPLFLIVFAVTVVSIGFWSSTNTQAAHRPPGQYTKTIRPTPAPHQCTQQQITKALLKPGTLEIWSTGSTSVAVNTMFHPSQYPLTIPTGKPLFTGMNLEPSSLSMGRDEQTGYYFINFSMRGDAIADLTYFTSHNIGSYIAITLNKIAVSSPEIVYTLPGKGQFQMSPRSWKALDIPCSL